MTKICFFETKEDRINLLPFTFLRSIADFRVGILTIREKWEKHLSSEETTFLTDNYLSTIYPAPKNDEFYLFINASLLPDHTLLEKVRNLKENQILSGANHESLAAICRLKDFENKNFISEITTYNYQKISFKWDIFQKNGEEIEKDYVLLTQNKKSQKISSSNLIIGNEEDIFLEQDVWMEGCILNCTKGKIYIGSGTTIMEGSMIRGPFASCNHAEVKMGAKIYGPTTLGPYCKAGGELNNVVMFAYSNKGHDGFIGNSVIAEWCNLGADTNCSNLKNTYDNVKVYSYATRNFEDSGLQFCGLFMGDHVKCSINSMFNTGTTVGICCNIFDSGFPPKFIPSFSWGGSSDFQKFNIEKLLESIENTMARRGKKLDAPRVDIIKNLYAQTYNFQ
jgi:UDP-N-acetylglucosamine diphosphorylase/glucosamine-1-phosphate N-acetyltransferase